MERELSKYLILKDHLEKAIETRAFWYVLKLFTRNIFFSYSKLFVTSIFKLIAKILIDFEKYGFSVCEITSLKGAYTTRE